LVQKIVHGRIFSSAKVFVFGSFPSVQFKGAINLHGITLQSGVPFPILVLSSRDHHTFTQRGADREFSITKLLHAAAVVKKNIPVFVPFKL
jgi:hypothetical protein